MLTRTPLQVALDGQSELSACTVAVLMGISRRRLDLILAGRLDPDEGEREDLMGLLEVRPDVFDEVE
jgi:hypothetical protein